MRTKHFGVYGLLAALLIMAIVMGGCAPVSPGAGTGAAAPAAEVPTIRFAYNWTGGDAKAEYYEGAIKKYMEANKDKVNIVLEGTPGDEHRTKVKVDLAGDNLADVMVYWSGEPTLQPFIEAGAIVDMDTVLAAGATTTRDGWTDSMLSNSIVDGKLWTLPVEAFKCFTIYNKSIFDQFGLTPPTTYEELKAVAAVLNENGIVPLDTGSKGGNPGHLLFNQLVDQFENGKSDVASVGTAFTVDTPAFNAAAAAIQQMVADKIFPSDTIANGDWGPSIVLYNEGKAGMLYSCPWMIGAIKPEIADVSEPMSLPALDGSAVDPSTFNVGGVTMGVVVKKAAFEDAATQAAVVDFVDFLVSDQMFTDLGKASMMPAKNVALDPAVLSPLFVKIVNFTSTQDTNDVLWSVLPDSASQESYSSAMDELFAGTPATDVIATIQEAVGSAKP